MYPVWYFLNGLPVIPVLQVGATLAGDGSASAPSYSFTSDPDTGLFWSSSGAMAYTANGTARIMFAAGLLRFQSASTLDWSSGNPEAGPTDLSFAREAAGHSFQRNSTNAQRASWANTYTSSTNYEAFSVDWQTQSTVAIVGTRTAATGTARALFLAAQGANGGSDYAALRLFAAPPFIRGGYLAANLVAQSSATAGNWVEFGEGTSTATSGSSVRFAIIPTYNQSSGTAANTDLLINRTQTAVGSGAQLLIDAQVGSATKFKVSNTGLAQLANRALETFTETTASTDGNMTYTAAQVLGGWITRSNMGSNRVDAFPTAADLVAGIPGAAVGHSFFVVVNNNDTAQTVTVNGASNGITYEGAATAIAATEARLFLCILTNVTGAAEAATVFQIV